MDFYDILEQPLPPLPRTLEDFVKPVIITDEYYEKLSDEEKKHYKPINKEEKENEYK